MANLRRLAFAVLAMAAMVGCYSPNITPGGFRCGDGSACPDKFRCAADGRCYREDMDASLDIAVDRPPVCTSVTSISTPVCASGAVGGQCNPSCQTECGGCGWCSVVAGASKCLIGTEGANDVGAVCDPISSTISTSCKAGLYCQPECGDTTGRCYRFCSQDNKDCGSGLTCTVNLRQVGGAAPMGQFLLCTLASATCDVVGKADCPAPYACYPFGAQQTECDCAGTANTGEPCGPGVSCVPGDWCVQFGATGNSTCLQACNGSADCTMGGTCSNPGTKYGYCM